MKLGVLKNQSNPHLSMAASGQSGTCTGHLLNAGHRELSRRCQAAGSFFETDAQNNEDPLVETVRGQRCEDVDQAWSWNTWMKPDLRWPALVGLRSIVGN